MMDFVLWFWQQTNKKKMTRFPSERIREFHLFFTQLENWPFQKLIFKVELKLNIAMKLNIIQPTQIQINKAIKKLII